MRLLPSFHSLYPRLKSAGLVAGAAAIAGLAVLGACSDDSVASKIAGTKIPQNPSLTAVAGVNHHHVLVCVTGGSTGGPFTFAVQRTTANDGLSVIPGVLQPANDISKWGSVGQSTDAWFENSGATDGLFPASYNVSQNNLGPYGPDVVTAAPVVTQGTCGDAFVRTNTCPGQVCSGDIYDSDGNRLWSFTEPNAIDPTKKDTVGVVNPIGIVDISLNMPAGYTINSVTCTNDDSNSPQKCQDGGYSSANVLHGSTFVYSITGPTQTGPCVLPNAAFGLGSAGAYVLLGLSGNNFTIGTSGTLIFGDVGVGPLNTGSMIKAKIDGNLFKDPTATTTIGADLKVTGTKTTVSLAGPSAAGIAASSALAALAPTQTFGNLTNNQTFTGVAGLNVIAINSVNVTGKTFTINGPAGAVFVFNVAGGFNFRSSQMVLTGGVTPHNILWNFPGSVGDVIVKDPSASAFGIFLAPSRNFNGDKSTITGGVIVGGSILLHSGGQLICEKTV